MTQLRDKVFECDGREPMTHEQANSAAKRMNFATKPYRCVHCGHWHIGSTSRRKGAAQIRSSKPRRRR